MAKVCSPTFLGKARWCKLQSYINATTTQKSKVLFSWFLKTFRISLERLLQLLGHSHQEPFLLSKQQPVSLKLPTSQNWKALWMRGVTSSTNRAKGQLPFWGELLSLIKNIVFHIYFHKGRDYMNVRTEFLEMAVQYLSMKTRGFLFSNRQNKLLNKGGKTSPYTWTGQLRIYDKNKKRYGKSRLLSSQISILTERWRSNRSERPRELYHNRDFMIIPRKTKILVSECNVQRCI